MTKSRSAAWRLPLTLTLPLALPLVTCVVLVSGATLGQEQTPASIPPIAQRTVADLHRPTVTPDRIILTWTDNPTTSQAVTWRTSTEITRGLAEIALAESGPQGQRNNARQLIAVTQPLETDLNAAHFHTVTFRDLTPAAKYAYRVGDGVNWSEWFLFTTASDQAEPLSFIYFGDAQNDVRSQWSRVIRSAWTDAPKAKFMIHAGDLINSAESDSEWGEWFDAGGWMNAMIPSIPIPGNHEQAKLEDGSRRLSHHWRPQFALPENGPEGLEETCFTLVCQNVRIVGLDSNRNHEEQAVWLDRLLSENTAEWVVCTFHHPIFSTGKDRDNAELRKLWKPVLDRHRVDLVLQGHDHTYGRTGLDSPTAEQNLATGVNTAELYSGTVYVVSVSGPKMYNLQRHPFMARQAEDTQLYQIIHVDSDKLHFEAFTATGELYDAFTLRKQPGQKNSLTDEIPDTPERLRPPVTEAAPGRSTGGLSRSR